MKRSWADWFNQTPTTIRHLLDIITQIADGLCGYPLFVVLIGGGLLLFIHSRAVSLRRLPHALRLLRENNSSSGDSGPISSIQALAAVVAATIGMGNIAGVAIALALGGPGAVFWMWVSAIIGMSTKYHEGVLAIKYRHHASDGSPRGGTMWIIDHALGRRWHSLALLFAVAGMFGTLCIMNANQLTEAVISVTGRPDTVAVRAVIGTAIAATVGVVVLGGIRRIARVATMLVPAMVAAYFMMVAWIILSHLSGVGAVAASIIGGAFSLEAGWGALIGIALIGARRAMLVNDAGVGTASLMHSQSANTEPVREGLMAMLGPAIDSGFVCTLTAFAILLCVDPADFEGVQGLNIAMAAFRQALPWGDVMLLGVTACFALSSMFSYSFYGSSCARYLGGDRGARAYTYFFIATLVVFAIIPAAAAVGLCDLFYALMAFPTMFTILRLRKEVARETQRYFNNEKSLEYGPRTTS